jgi:hypothetical protein
VRTVHTCLSPCTGQDVCTATTRCARSPGRSRGAAARGCGQAGTGSRPGIAVGCEMEIFAVSGISMIGTMAMSAAPIR